MQLITDDYKKLNEDLHASNKNYGTSGHLLADEVMFLAKQLNTTDILDYGCGKGTLANNLPFSIKQYDPAIEKHAELPRPADLVVCTDVFEHIEPDLIDNVLTHLQALVKQCGLFSASTVPALKHLSDGRNAHILLKDDRWWINKIMDYFHINQFRNRVDAVFFIVKPKDSKDS